MINMSALPEAKLAREAEIAYCMICMSTDYDCWREGEAVDTAQILAQLDANARKARALVQHLVAGLPEERPASPIDTCLDSALMTAPSMRDPTLVARLDAVAGRALRRT